jgi:hypothetical protein
MRVLEMTYNFDPERWHENEYSALETPYKNGTITNSEFEEQCSNLQRRYEEMLSRLDGLQDALDEGYASGVFVTSKIFSYGLY